MRRGVVANSQLLRNIKGLSHRKSLNSLFSASKGNISLLNYTKPYTTATTASATVASHIMAERSTTDIKNVSVPDCSKATASSSAQDPSIDKAETEEKKEEEKLPPLSAHEFQIYNRPSARMDAFHNHFRQTWNTLWKACVAGKRPSGMTLRQFIDTGLEFSQQLTMHHDIEETYIFPKLAKKMPEFNAKTGILVLQHVDIHKGLDEYAGYLQRCRKGEEDFEMSGLKERMETWGEVLWTHLDLEVKTLGAENMRKYWTIQDMRNLPM